MASAPDGADDWLRVFHRRAGQRLRLVCLPHAGGAAGAYFALSRELDPRYEVAAVQYPGHQDRMREPLVGDMERLADRLADAMEERAAEPYAFFGHSMGALLSFEVARRLRERGVPGPRRLIVSGMRAPTRLREGRIHLLDDAGLIQELLSAGGTDPRVLAEPELLAAILPVTRNDYHVVETYRFSGGPPLDCPVTVLVGDRDPQTTIEEAGAWADHTTGPFDLRVFPGGHFYLDERAAEVRAAIESALERSEPSSSAGRAGRAGSADGAAPDGAAPAPSSA